MLFCIRLKCRSSLHPTPTPQRVANLLCLVTHLGGGDAGADPGFFLEGGALVSCSTSTPINHIVFFFRRIPVVLENRRSSQGGCAPPAPSPSIRPWGGVAWRDGWNLKLPVVWNKHLFSFRLGLKAVIFYDWNSTNVQGFQEFQASISYLSNKRLST